MPDLLTGILHGGLTEEAMLRWGLMSLLAVGTLRLMTGSSAIKSAAIIAALALAAMHLPAVMLEAGALTMPLIAPTMLWNTVLGLIFGLGFMRGGLESAIGTHVGFHIGVAALAASFGA